LFSPSKCLRLHKQRTPQQHGAADMSTGDSISRRKCAALEWTHPLPGLCGLSSALFDQLLMACEDVNKSSLSSAAAAGGGGAIYRCRLCLYASDKVRSLLHSTHSLSLYFALHKLSSQRHLYLLCLHAQFCSCSLAVLDPRVGHTTDVLSPFIPVLCHSD